MDKNKEEEDLDISWIQQQERLQNIQSNYCREPMNSIRMLFLYINQNKYIEQIVCEDYSLNDSPTISNETVLHLVQTKRQRPASKSKYKLLDILTYQVDLEPQQIQSYANNREFCSESSRFFKTIPIVNDIPVLDSIFIFHEINAIYFLFQEIPTETSPNHRHTLKSILKPTSPPKKEEVTGSESEQDSESKFVSTKKVRILLNKKRKTRKIVIE